MSKPRKPTEITPHLIDEMRRLRLDGHTCEAASKILGVGHGTVSKYTQNLIDPEKAERTAREENPDYSFTENSQEGTATLVMRTDEIVKTYEDAIRIAKIDTTIWCVDRWEKKSWTTPMRIRQGQDEKGRHLRDKAIQTQQHGVKLFLKRIMPIHIKAVVDSMYERMKTYSPKYQKVKETKKTVGEEILAVFGLFDAHFGKLAWSPETGQNYDLDIAETVYKNAVLDLIAESEHRNIVKIILPIGNDFFHMDNRANTTLNGTPQDVDGRYIKIFEVGCMAVIWAVEQLMQIAPVEVVWVPGNHDPTISYHLSKTIEAWFRNSNRVAVDSGPSPRKYVQWEKTLLGFTHGSEERHPELPDIMANERSSDWHRSTCREWLIGHIHLSRKYVTKEHDSHRSTVVRILRSIAGVDAWHHRKGYVGTRQAAEVFFYGKESGYCGHSIVSARTESE
jgi:hypothetical protein